MAHFRTLSEISYELADRLPKLLKSKPIFFLAQSEKEARAIAELCQYWYPQFPDWTIISPYQVEGNSISPKEFKKRTIQLQTKNTLRISQLTQQLVELGFERYPRAVAPHTFAIRGNIVDIIAHSPLRIEFDDNEISSINHYDPNTQETSETLLTNAVIWPHTYSKAATLWHEHDLAYNFVTPRFYHKRYHLLKDDLKEFTRVQVASKQPDRVFKIIPQAHVTERKRNLEGFVLDDQHFLFLTDPHIFGSETEAETFDSAIDVDTLQPGEYVVHIDHGVALFHDFKTMGKDTYLELRYANNDKLYIPTDKANRIEKYIGSDSPRLTKLSGAHWETMVKRVKDNALETARELLEMHSERATTIAKSIPAETTTEEEAIALDVDFQLTSDQEHAINDILNDLSQDTAMDRLLCGDVGFGKTEVALRAAAHVVQHGGQVAIMAPTTVLAQQHYETLMKRLEPYGIEVGLLSRLSSAQETRNTLKKIKNNQIDVIVGTHRLLSKDIVMPKLQLAIIDEEQRFGVKHKAKFKNMRANSHVLTMTATPIPRTLNLAMSGLQDISVLNTAPSDRRGIHTIIEEINSEIEIEALSQELERRGQAYVVHNNLQTIYSRQLFFQKHFPKARIEIVHGKMNSKQMVRIMHDFHAGTIDILLASTIIENGLDIANANTLIVEHAENFGLAQLYQLRGRIGRSDRQAYAYLLYSASNLTEKAKKRLKALHAIKELGGGFELAMQDLQIRGVGDILGKKQHGHVHQIGLHMYTRLLQHAIEKLRAGD